MMRWMFVLICWLNVKISNAESKIDVKKDDDDDDEDEEVGVKSFSLGWKHVKFQAFKMNE